MIHKLNPATVHEPAGYSHVTISSSGRLAHLAGQCPVDLSGEVVGKSGDHAAQTNQVIANCLAVLDAAGARPADVVRSVIYVVSADSEVLSEVWRQRDRWFEGDQALRLGDVRAQLARRERNQIGPRDH
jgi:enamine deaminase RidA (YjgF/YER057c/UK114 family)